MRIQIGYQLSISLLFVATVLSVGLAPVAQSVGRARTITRAAALSCIDSVAGHTTDRMGGQ